MVVFNDGAVSTESVEVKHPAQCPAQNQSVESVSCDHCSSPAASQSDFNACNVYSCLRKIYLQ